MTANQIDLDRIKNTMNEMFRFYFSVHTKIFQFDYIFVANWVERLTVKWSHKIIQKTESIQIEYHLKSQTQKKMNLNGIYYSESGKKKA